MITLEDLLQAYFQCRQHKRNTANALKFEIDYESKLLDLYREIMSGNYRVGRYVAFITSHPLKREIFAADFRDRVVHHLLINQLNPLLEKQFIYDSYACRKNKGTLFGIRRIDRFIRQCSVNYTKPAYVLKLDIKSYFADINKNILFDKLQRFMAKKYQGDDGDLLLRLGWKIIFSHPTDNCIRKSQPAAWDKLPRGKSLFDSANGSTGLPIGNLTSQTFSNFYLDAFDHFVKHDLNIRYYGRYVDDIVFIHQDKEFLQAMIKTAGDWLRTNLRLRIHPRKIYLQPIERGVEFLGVRILPHRIILAKRIKRNINKKISRCNWLLANLTAIDETVKKKIRTSANSYLGITRHFNTYQYRRAIIDNKLTGRFRDYFMAANGYNKIVLNFKIKSLLEN